jgi:hypothetical protein
MYVAPDRDKITKNEDLERPYTFHSFSVFMGASVAIRAQYLVSDLSFWISRSSGMIQLNPLLLYLKAHGTGLIGGSWRFTSRSLLNSFESPLVIIRAGTFTNKISIQLKSINPSAILVT